MPGTGLTATGSISRELATVAALSRVRLAEADVRRLAELHPAELDWESVQRQSLRHAVFPLVHRHAASGALPDLPGEVAAHWHALALESAAHSHALAGELLGLTAALRRAGVDAVAYKGPALADELYGDISLRSCGDLDLLVSRAELEAADVVLRSEGYLPAQSLTAIQLVAERRLNYFAEYRCAKRNVCLEIHWRAAEAHTLGSGAWKRLLGGHRVVQLAGQDIRVPTPEALLVLLCIHGGRHLWETLRLVTDVAEWMRVYGPTHLDSALEFSRELGCRRLLMLGMSLAATVLHTELPEALTQTIRSDPAVENLTGIIAHRLLHDTRWHDPVEQQLLFLGGRERLRDRLRYVSALVHPTERDWAHPLPLPPYLWRAYYVSRPFRLARGLWRRRSA